MLIEEQTFSAFFEVQTFYFSVGEKAVEKCPAYSFNTFTLKSVHNIGKTKCLQIVT